MKRVSIWLLTALFALFSFAPLSMAKAEPVDAVVIASFGTSYPEALKSILSIDKEMRRAFPKAQIKHAFTSNIIRKIWHERASDPAWKKEHPQIPAWLFDVKGPLSTLGELQEEGKKRVVVQTTHVYAGEEYLDLKAYVDAIAGIETLRAKWRPFSFLKLGRPALGKPGVHPEYHEDINLAAKTVSADVEKAKKLGAALVYMGHGNDIFPTSAYIEFQKAMNAIYPDVVTISGNVEGYPGLDHVVETLKKRGIKKIFMKPFMVVAGDHARNDMAGDEEDAWRVIFEKMGIHVT
ncbi:MAG: sirohydrochlorin cobaltochelatase, partial [Desulfobacterales bacterium]|nr:sirohydrochlorin cobaltochelatase [Desulfobacterales bacterium]